MKSFLICFLFTVFTLCLRAQSVYEAEWELVPVGYLNFDKNFYYNLAKKLYREGNYADAKSFYEHAAELGHLRACAELSLGYMDGKFSTKRDYNKAMEWAQKGIERNDPYSLSAYGIILFKTSPSLNGKLQALDPLEKASKLKLLSVFEANILGVCYLLKGELDKALEWIERGLSIGEKSPDASYYIAKAILSKIYMDMDLGSLSDTLAVKHAEESANWDNPIGNYVLGRMLIENHIDSLQGLVLIEEALKYDYPRLIDIDIFRNEILEYYNYVKENYDI